MTINNGFFTTKAGEVVWTLGAIFIGVFMMSAMVIYPFIHREELGEEYRNNCDKRGGIMLSSKSIFGTSQKCVENWNN